MYTVDHFVRNFRKDSQVTINLFHKIPPGGMDYRPTAGQRSVLELLRYLSYGPYNAVLKITAGDWNISGPTNAVTQGVPPSDFPQRMAWQADAVERLVRATPITALLNDDFTLPWGETMKKGEALVNYPLKWLAAYRMQLFLYLKSAGAANLATADLWHVPAPAAPKAP